MLDALLTESIILTSHILACERIKVLTLLLLLYDVLASEPQRCKNFSLQSYGLLESEGILVGWNYDALIVTLAQRFKFFLHRGVACLAQF